jgi:prevent-host-death family protein
MEISTKELRDNPGRTLSRVARGQEITVTYRGKAVARIIPVEQDAETGTKEEDLLFGLWKDRAMENVDAHVRGLRKGRTF